MLANSSASITVTKHRNAGELRIRELVAWGLDENEYRPWTGELLAQIECARNALTRRRDVVFKSPLIPVVPPSVLRELERQRGRVDLHAEMNGLDWEIGVVNIERLIAFQRRLAFDDTNPDATVPSPDDWPALIDFAFGPPVPVIYRAVALKHSQLLLQSENPNFELRTCAQGPPLQPYGGSPFFEVAEFNQRWFLRDGYHRAYRLLRAGIVHVPAVIIKTRTLAQLGAVQPWFFAENTLFSARPPLVTDFLKDDLTLEYNRPRLYKTIRITMEESIEPEASLYALSQGTASELA